MFYIYISALFSNTKQNEIIINGYITVFEQIMESITQITSIPYFTQKQLHRHTQNRKQKFFFKFKVYYLLEITLNNLFSQSSQFPNPFTNFGIRKVQSI